MNSKRDAHSKIVILTKEKIKANDTSLVDTVGGDRGGVQLASEEDLTAFSKTLKQQKKGTCTSTCDMNVRILVHIHVLK